jgi:hypothetical protein
METGEYKIGTEPKRNKTGKGAAVRIIKVKSVILGDEAEATTDEEVDLFYALGNNLKIYKVEEKDFENPGFKNEKVEEFKEKTEGKGKYKSYLGYDFGETIPPNVSGYTSMLEEIFSKDAKDITEEELEQGHLIFLGMEPDMDDPESEDLIRLCWVLKEEEDDSPMEEALLEKQTFVKRMLIPMDTPKRMTVHYINHAGEKTNMSVNEISDIKDLKEFLYKFDN